MVFLDVFLIDSVLSNPEMNVILNGHLSRSFFINVGDSKDSIPGPILFLIYINDLPDDTAVSMLMTIIDSFFRL